MKFGSLFSGVGGFDLGFERAGMRCAWQCEIDPKASAVLAKHWPGIPNIGDVKNVTAGYVEPVDLICGGFPCQDLSVAGKRKGLAGERSGLWFEFHRILSELRPRWVVVENVPGLLSSNGGRDFAVILHGLGELGYLSAWRILDAQYFGVPQRRRRVFIVASLGNGRCAEVLFEREGLPGDTSPRREAEQKTACVTGTLSANGGGTTRQGANKNEVDFCVPAVSDIGAVAFGGNNTSAIDVATCLNAHSGRMDFESETFLVQKIGLWHSHGQDGDARVYGDISPTASRTWGSGGGNVPYIGVRRLTPTECERLQGFPDGWTAMGADGKPQADSARYKQMGNAVCVAFAEWLGRRIVEAQS